MDDRQFERAQRRARITAVWLETGSVSQTARQVGVARSTVYKLLEARPEMRKALLERRQARAADVLAWSTTYFGCSLEEGALELGLPSAFLRQVLGPRTVLHPRRRAPRGPRYSDEELLDGLRLWNVRSGSTRMVDYDRVARVDPALASGGTLIARFGSWSAALECAGIASQGSASGGARVRWTDDQLREVLSEYVNAVAAGADMGGLTRWLNANPHRPSPATVRNRIGDWQSILEFVTGRAAPRTENLASDPLVCDL